MIYVISHKDVELNLPQDYRVLGVGNNKIKNEDFHDNTGNNISKKNDNYCELTGLYWIWHNIKDDIVGLTHYRRIFTEDKMDSVNLVEYSEIQEFLKKYDIVLPPLFDNKTMTVYQHYCTAHKKEDIDKVIEIALKLYPEYTTSIDYVMNQKYEYGFNMFISNKEICDNYSKWLFSILNILEPQIDLTTYDSYQQRIFGFLSERLFTVWLYHNKLKIKELYITNPAIDKEVTKEKKLIKMSRPIISLYKD